MPHREHQFELLSAYLDGELTPPQARNLEEALADDPALRAELERLKRARDAVRTLPRQAAPAALAERVLGHIERGSVLAEGATAPAGRRSHWAFHVSAAAAAVVLLGLGLGAYLLLRQPSYLDRQLLAQKEAPADQARKAVIAPASEPQPELAAARPQVGQDRFAAETQKDKADKPSAGLVGPVPPENGRPEQLAANAGSQPTELARTDQLAGGESANAQNLLRGSENQENLRGQIANLLNSNQAAKGQSVAADQAATSPAAAAYRLRNSAPAGQGESSVRLTAQGPPLYEPSEAAPAAAPAMALAPSAVTAAKSLGVARMAARSSLVMAEAKPAVYFDLAEPDLRLVIRVKDLAAAQDHMRQVLEVAKQAHVAAAAADLGGAMCVSFNGRIIRQDGTVQYEFRIHPRAMPPLVRALTEMESLEQSWQVLQSPRTLESKWQVLRECLGEAMAATQPVRDRVVISRQELPTTRGAADSIEMFSSYSLVDSAAATVPSGHSGPPPAATSPASRPAQQWVEPYNLIVRIEAVPPADSAATNLAPASSATTAASRPAP